MSDKLKPCPFCGGEAHLADDYSSERDETRWNVWHDCDGFKGESSGYGYSLHPWFETPWYRDEQTAIAAWNRRAFRTARRVIVADPATDCATGHCECGNCGGAVDPWDAWCRHCGSRLED